MTIAAKWWVCGLLFLATTLNYMDRIALNQMARRIQDAFLLSDTQYGTLEGTFSAVFAFGALFAGWLVDRWDIRILYPLMVFGWSLAGYLTGEVASFWQLLICRAMLGFFEASNWPCGIRTTRLLLPPEERSFGNAIFQSGTAIGAIITPLIILQCLAWADSRQIADPWRLPFRIIGLLGLVWIALWFYVVRQPLRVPTAEAGITQESGSFRDVLRDRRFWVLMIVIIAVNSTWHSFRVWLPKFLAESHGKSETFTQTFSSGYYLAADLGSLSVGMLTLWLARRGMELHTARLVLFGVCAFGTLLAIAVAFLPTGTLLLISLLLLGAAALGLFPTYFALSQQISSVHQGKITGTLGFINAIALAGLFPIQGQLITLTGSYTIPFAVAGLPPMIAFIVLMLFWRRVGDSPPTPAKAI